MTTKAERDERIRALLEALFDQAAEGRGRVAPEVDRDLTVIFSVTQWGFREILLTVVIARMLDSGYRPSRALYDCNPRALYEGPIRSVLSGRRIPHRLSGPLNIAKAAAGLNRSWAAQRRPKQAAD